MHFPGALLHLGSGQVLTCVPISHLHTAGTLNSLHDLVIPGASAEIAGNSLLDFHVGRIAFLLKQLYADIINPGVQ